MGGQTALNVAMALGRAGVLERYGVELIGASEAGDRQGRGPPALPRRRWTGSGSDSPKSRLDAHAGRSDRGARDRAGCRPSSGPPSRWAAPAAASPTTLEEFEEIVRGGLRASPTSEVLIEESVLGWKEFEMEVVRDQRGQLHHRLLDREHRSDGGAHRRFGHVSPRR